MGQLGLFDADKRLAAISAKGAPLELIDRVVPFECFRAKIESVVLTPAEDKKISAGRKPIDVIVISMSDHTRAWQKHKVRPPSAAKSPEKTNTDYCIYHPAHWDYTYNEKWI
jgi:hypothetical protein